MKSLKGEDLENRSLAYVQTNPEVVKKHIEADLRARHSSSTKFAQMTAETIYDEGVTFIGQRFGRGFGRQWEVLVADKSEFWATRLIFGFDKDQQNVRLITPN